MWIIVAIVIAIIVIAIINYKKDKMEESVGAAPGGLLVENYIPVIMNNNGYRSERDIQLISSNSGGENTTDSTRRINLASYQRNESPNFFGEVMRIDSKAGNSKQMIVWRDATTTPYLEKVWMGWHYLPNDVSDTLSPHDHFSIETPDSTNNMITRFEIVASSSDTTQINTFNSNFTVIQGTSGVTATNGNTASFSMYDAGTDRNKTLRWSMQGNSTSETGSDVGKDFQISSFSDLGAFTRTPFFIKRSTGDVGIGSTSPFARLGVQITTNGTGLLVQNTTGGGNTAANFLAKAQTSTSRAFQAGLQSDSTNRYSIDVAGLTEWGPGGSTARDTSLERAAAGNLKFTNAGSNATSTFTIGKTSQNKGSCLELYDAAGTAVYAYVATGATTFSLSANSCK